MDTLTLFPCAKINLTMEVFGRREDGYHHIRSVMESVSLRDRLTIRRIPSGFRFHCSIPELSGEDNLVVRAWRLLADRFALDGAELELEKQIPWGSGMGGGSSDCAGALLGLARMFQLPLSLEELMKLGKSLGADVPFCLLGQPALAAGIGEILSPLPAGPQLELIILMPPASFSTPEMYRRLDSRPEIPTPISLTSFLEGLEQGDVRQITHGLLNHFEEAVPAPQLLKKAKDSLLAAGAWGASMTGAGAAVFGVFPDGDTADRAMDHLISAEDWQIYRCHTLADPWSEQAQKEGTI